MGASSMPEEALALLRERRDATRGEPGLEQYLASIIAQRGRITFEEFMDAALYHPQYGYYAAPVLRVGRDGDYITSPEVGPAFGHCLARRLLRLSRELALASAEIVEVGGGSGRLCRDILLAAKSIGLDVRRYTLVEPNQFLVGMQTRLLEEAGMVGRVRWADALDELPAQTVTGFVVANEVIDALPVHRVVTDRGSLKEVYVTFEGGVFREALGEPSTPEIAEYLFAQNIVLGEGQWAEINLRAKRWLEQASRALKLGAVVIIDYGYPAAELCSARFAEGTLLCYYKHSTTRNPYLRIGRQDITAHVDFSALERWGAAMGMSADPLMTQREMLLQEGILKSAPTATARRQALELIDPQGLGRLKLFVLRRQ
ncbi:MAG: class I SAM-dependent methyltransferase [Armatimonadota bacterium]